MIARPRGLCKPSRADVRQEEMGTAEFAEVRGAAGAYPARTGPRYATLRRFALLGYATAFVIASLTWGVPLQTQLVILWTCGGLACASIGRDRSEIIQLAKDWAPLAAILLVYDFSRGAVDSFGIPVHTHFPVDFDRWMFGGDVPTVWLQERILDPHHRNWWDTAFTVVYSSHFIAWLAIAGVLWNRNREMFLGFTRRLVTLGFAGLAPYLVYPATPPWMASDMGIIGAVHRSTARGWKVLDLHTAQTFERGQAVVNQVAAVPSLHAGFSALIALYFLPRVRWFWRPLLLAYPLAMAFSLVATGEHYVFDILLGWVYAGAVLAAWDWWDRRKAERSAAAPEGATTHAATAAPGSA